MQRLLWDQNNQFREIHAIVCVTALYSKTKAKATKDLNSLAEEDEEGVSDNITSPPCPILTPTQIRLIVTHPVKARRRKVLSQPRNQIENTSFAGVSLKARCDMFSALGLVV